MSRVRKSAVIGLDGAHIGEIRGGKLYGAPGAPSSASPVANEYPGNNEGGAEWPSLVVRSQGSSSDLAVDGMQFGVGGNPRISSTGAQPAAKSTVAKLVEVMHFITTDEEGIRGAIPEVPTTQRGSRPTGNASGKVNLNNGSQPLTTPGGKKKENNRGHSIRNASISVLAAASVAASGYVATQTEFLSNLKFPFASTEASASEDEAADFLDEIPMGMARIAIGTAVLTDGEFPTMWDVDTNEADFDPFTYANGETDLHLSDIEFTVHAETIISEDPESEAGVKIIEDSGSGVKVATLDFNGIELVIEPSRSSYGDAMDDPSSIPLFGGDIADVHKALVESGEYPADGSEAWLDTVRATGTSDAVLLAVAKAIESLATGQNRAEFNQWVTDRIVDEVHLDDSSWVTYDTIPRRDDPSLTESPQERVFLDAIQQEFPGVENSPFVNLSTGENPVTIFTFLDPKNGDGATTQFGIEVIEEEVSVE